MNGSRRWRPMWRPGRFRPEQPAAVQSFVPAVPLVLFLRQRLLQIQVPALPDGRGDGSLSFYDDKELQAIFTRTYGEPKRKLASDYDSRTVIRAKIQLL